MIFARYKGPRCSSFVDGKVYLATPVVDNEETVNFDFLEMTDEDGRLIRTDPEDDKFEYLDEVYVTLLKPIGTLNVGDVCVADTATEDGQFLHIKAGGYRLASGFIVLDRTNVFPGIMLLDKKSGVWVKVTTVDECLWVTVETDEESRPPSDFSFAVAEGDILTEPVVRCVLEAGEANLTKDRWYVVRRVEKDGLWTILDDSGQEGSYMASRFLMGK